MGNDGAIRCGPFEIIERIGEGGMGAVYRARHTGDGTDAAIKVMTIERATAPRFRRAFRREARALGRLNHPYIATIFDFGTLDRAAAARGPEPFKYRAPWFAMEYVEGTDLGQIAGLWTWNELESFLHSILDALAHSHARRVLHRDLTPSNIRVEAGGEADQIKIVDFGVARLSDPDDSEAREDDGDTVQGTPRYMAPEQIRGDHRDQGPWTDLYALGCLVWRIVCGEPPFEGDTTEETFQAHFEGMSGQFESRMSVPPDFEPWLRGLIEHTSADRCRRAADAAFELAHMTPPDGYVASESLESTWESGGRPTMATVHDVEWEESDREACGQYDGTVAESEPVPDSSAGHDPDGDSREVLEFSAPPIPVRWQRERDGLDDLPLSGSGLELFALRRLPLVDRRPERDELWEALRRVVRERSPRAVALVGPPGSGKSRLAEWLAERAHEVGAARTLLATHAARGGRQHGLGAALIRHFGCQNLEGSEAISQLTAIFEGIGISRQTGLTDAVGLLELAGRETDQPEGKHLVGFQTPRERNAALVRMLRGVAEQTRPLVLRLDDIPRSPESTAFVRHVMTSEQCRDLPILLVMTARRAEWNAAELLSAMFSEGGSDRRRFLNIGPLEADDHRTLVRRMLRFDESLVDKIVERTEGHPLFAIQLVQAWVDSGRLTCENGQCLLEGDDRLPDNLERLWAERIDHVLSRLPVEQRDDAERRLELAAALGKQVDVEEWRAVCERANLEVIPDLVERMLGAGLARERSEGWQFVHGMLAESLLRRAERAGRRARHHQLCAEMLEQLYPHKRERTAERRADHRIEAGQPRRALSPLLEAVRYMADHDNDLRRATELLDRHRSLMDACGLPDEDRRRIEHRLELTDACIARGKVDRANRILDRLETIIERHEQPRLWAKWNKLSGALAAEQGRYDEARGRIDTAESAFRRLGDDEQLARTLRMRGHVVHRTRSTERARQILEQARRLCERNGDAIGAMLAQKKIAWAWLDDQEFEPAASIAKKLVSEARNYGARILEADGFNFLGEIARNRGEWNGALRLYRRSRRLWREAGSRKSVLADLNIAFTQAGADRWNEARPILKTLEKTLPEHGFETRLIHVHLGLAGWAADRGDWERWSARLEALEEELAAHDYRIADAPWLAERGAETCLEAEALDAARRMYRLARRLWNDVDLEEEADRVGTRLQQLGSAGREP